MNNIKKLLEEKNISIRRMSIDLDMSYSFAHEIVNRENLDSTTLGTLKVISNYLNVRVDELIQ